MAKTKKRTVGAKKVTVDRRRTDRRSRGASCSAAEAPATPEVQTAPPPRASERRKVPRRRQIDPTTCERDYSDDEIEFMQALDAYKRAAGRMFPTCSEVLEVIRGLGYIKLGDIDMPTDAFSATQDRHESAENQESMETAAS